MVSCTRQPLTMLPLVPINPFAVANKTSAPAATTPVKTAPTTTTVSTSSKPKLAFSIDALVGEQTQSPKSLTVTSRIFGPQRSTSPKGIAERLEPLELRNSRFLTKPPSPNNSRSSVINSGHESDPVSPVRECNSTSRDQTQSPLPNDAQQHSSRSTTPLHSPREATSPEENRIFKSQAALPPGLIRPFPLQAPSSMPLIRPGEAGLIARGSLSAGSMPQSQVPGQAPTTSNPHLLAAQFQMAAVLAHHQQQQQHQHQAGPHPPPPPGPPAPPHLPPHLVHGHHLGIFPPGPHHPPFGNPHLIRDTYPLYPWLLSRHGRIFSHRFPGFLLQPFRKPKRVRTAFSPTQLLKLEHAFEENHYVVGAERKQLAQNLSLTETQVKVWFQNRRTKHKRMQQEGDSDSKSQKGSQSGDNEGRNDSSQTSFEDQDDLDMADGDDIDEDEDEVIDMDDYDEQQLTDAEERKRLTEHFHEMQARHFPHGPMFQQHSPHHQQFLHQHFFQQQQQQQQQQQHQQSYAQSEHQRQQPHQQQQPQQQLQQQQHHPDPTQSQQQQSPQKH